MSGRCVQKATLGSFSGDGLGRLGLNPAGVCHGFALLSPVWNRLFWQDAWRKWRLVLFSHVRRRNSLGRLVNIGGPAIVEIQGSAAWDTWNAIVYLFFGALWPAAQILVTAASLRLFPYTFNKKRTLYVIPSNTSIFPGFVLPYVTFFSFANCNGSLVKHWHATEHVHT